MTKKEYDGWDLVGWIIAIIILLPLVYFLGALVFKWAWKVIVHGMFGLPAISLTQSIAILILLKTIKWVLG